MEPFAIVENLDTLNRCEEEFLKPHNITSSKIVNSITKGKAIDFDEVFDKCLTEIKRVFAEEILDTNVFLLKDFCIFDNAERVLKNETLVSCFYTFSYLAEKNNVWDIPSLFGDDDHFHTEIINNYKMNKAVITIPANDRKYYRKQFCPEKWNGSLCNSFFIDPTSKLCNSGKKPKNSKQVLSSFLIDIAKIIGNQKTFIPKLSLTQPVISYKPNYIKHSLRNFFQNMDETHSAYAENLPNESKSYQLLCYYKLERFYHFDLLNRLLQQLANKVNNLSDEALNYGINDTTAEKIMKKIPTKQYKTMDELIKAVLSNVNSDSFNSDFNLEKYQAIFSFPMVFSNYTLIYHYDEISLNSLNNMKSTLSTLKFLFFDVTYQLFEKNIADAHVQLKTYFDSEFEKLESYHIPKKNPPRKMAVSEEPSRPDDKISFSMTDSLQHFIFNPWLPVFNQLNTWCGIDNGFIKDDWELLYQNQHNKPDYDFNQNLVSSFNLYKNRYSKKYGHSWIKHFEDIQSYYLCEFIKSLF